MPQGGVRPQRRQDVQEVKAPFAGITSMYATALVLSYAGYEKDVKALLNLLCKESQKYYDN